MDTTNIVAILIFILPGILAEKTSYRMDLPSHEERSDFREIINGILLSIPIIFISGLVAWKINGFNTLGEMIEEFDNLKFLTTFSVLVFALAILLGIIKGLSKEYFTRAVNWIRKIFGKMEIDDNSCWRNTFLEENKPGYVKILKDGNVLAEGFVCHYSFPNESQEIVFHTPENLEDYPDYKDYLRLNKTYVNIDKGVIIEAYDTSPLENYASPKEKE